MSDKSADIHLDWQKNYYRVCTKTVMDTTDPGITFDADGVSNHWHEYHRIADEVLPYTTGDDNALDRLVDAVKKSGRGKPFDALLGISGGVDSTYLAYRAHELGIRVLAVHFDNGWNSELAVRNVERALKATGAELHTHVVNWNEFRDLQLSYIKANVIGLEIPTDHAIVAMLYKLAAKHGIKYLLSGSNHVTEGILPDAWVYNAMDASNIVGIHKRFGTRPLKTYPLLTMPNLAYYTMGLKISAAKILNMREYNKQDAMRTIEEKLGWQYYGGKHYESIFTRFYQSYILPRKFGVDKRRAHYSTLICSGQISRDDALVALKEPPAPADLLKEDWGYFLEKLGITEQEFDAYLATPPVSHLAYANNQNVMNRARELKGRLKLTIR